MICRAGANFDRNRFQCRRGILTGELSLRKQCRITLTKALTTFTTVHEILPGVIVILTRGEKVSLLCSGDPKVRLTILSGAYALRLRQDCHLKAKGWSISGMTRLSSFIMPPVECPLPFRFPNLLKFVMHQFPFLTQLRTYVSLWTVIYP